MPTSTIIGHDAIAMHDNPNSTAYETEGGPAFARPPVYGAEELDVKEEGHDGMSLRDYFAAQALAPLCEQHHNALMSDDATAVVHAARLVAHAAFAVADAMVAARHASHK